MTDHPLEIVRASPIHLGPLAAFFSVIAADPGSEHFHPHPFDLVNAERISGYPGRDLYYLATTDRVAAYGMLRGWDEGYAVPSLWIVVHPDSRGTGLGKVLMQFLHQAARTRGAEQIRLKVYSSNAVARRLYEKLGYRFQGEEAGQCVGVLTLVS